MSALLARFVRPLLLLLGALCAVPTAAQTTGSCSAAASAGAAANGWDTYCWLNFANYNETTARSAGGQVFAIPLSDGSTFNVTLRVASANATALNAVAAPSWTGGAVGNTSFLGIPGRPILYTASGGVVTATMSNMSIVAPGGGSGTFMFIVADAESTNDGEALRYDTNGGNWQLLDLIPPISGAVFPPYSMSGNTVTVTGTGGTVGGQIFGSIAPSTVTTTLTAGGLQGVMFAVRFASIRLNATVVGSRLNAADQLTYSVRSTTSGSALVSNTSTGTGLGPFASATASLASGFSITLNQVMAAGSVSTMGQYQTRLTCTNTNPAFPGTTMPNNVVTTNFVMGSVAFGDAISCTFVNAPAPRLRLAKVLSANRINATDQITLQVLQGATTTAQTTTTGTGTTVANGVIGPISVIPATAYTLTEIAAGTTVLALYQATLTCTNAVSSATTLPTTVGGTVTPTWGDNVSCTITNTPSSNRALLTMSKTSFVISDPLNGTTNPKLIPGALVRYDLTVTNIGTGPVDAGGITLIDPLPSTVAAVVTGTPIVFTDGTPPSGLNWVASSAVSWTTATSGFGYTPVPDANGTDLAITAVRVRPAGTMVSGTIGSQPSFTISLQARVR